MNTLTMATIDKYYNLRAKYQSATQDYNITPNVINDVNKKKALGDLLAFCLKIVADMAGDLELGSHGRGGIDIYG